MRLIKMFGLAALLAVASMALMGASSAMAKENTAICTVHKEPCPEANLVKHVHFIAKESKLLATFLGAPITILCLESLALGDVESPFLGTAPNPLGIKMTEITWVGCGTTATHNNCTVTTLNAGLFDVLKTALNLGEATALGAEVLVKCTIAGVNLHCVYGGPKVGPFSVEGALHTVNAGHGMFTTPAGGLAVEFISGANCPETAKWHALFEPLVHLYITG